MAPAAALHFSRLAHNPDADSAILADDRSIQLPDLGSNEEAARMQHLHAQAFRRYSSQVRPLPGARELLAYLAQAHVPYAIATRSASVMRFTMRALRIPSGSAAGDWP